MIHALKVRLKSIRSSLIGRVTLSCLAAGVVHESAEAQQKLLPPATGIYHAAFPDFGPEEDIVSTARVRRFVEETAERSIVWAYFSDNWFNGIEFPERAVRRIADAGSLPFIRMMPRADWQEGCGNRHYSLQSIIEGQHDRALRDYARAAAAYAEPLIIEFGTEVNGNWFPWSGACNGGGEKRGYGSPSLADGPERFRDAYRRVITLFHAEGASNVTWFLHLDAYSAPSADWNHFDAYYPGSEFIDWIGVSVYGAQSRGELDSWNPSFTRVMGEIYPALASIDPAKPLAVLEFGVVEHTGMTEWVSDALNAISAREFPRVKAMAYWHSDWPNGDGTWTRMRLDSISDAAATYRQIVANDMFVTQPVLSR